MVSDSTLSAEGVSRWKKQLSKEDIPVTWINETARLLDRGPCVCEEKSLSFTKTMAKDEKEDLKKRRKKELEKFRDRVSRMSDPLLLVRGHCPLSYPSMGLQVVPGEAIGIPGLSVDDAVFREQYKVEFSAEFGVLDIAAEVTEVDTSGRKTNSLKIECSCLVHLNRQLDFLVYINTEAELGRLDLANFRYLDHDVTIPIRINFRPVPLLYDPGSDDNIDRKVTVVTKTFLRYFSVRNLIRSIRKFYPTIRIVIADDSRPVENLQGDNVDHYIMPFGVGWFAGRNLAVSQVKTPYMLWVDDDFLFIPETKLEKFVDVLDNADIDIVSGLVGRDRISLKKLNILEGDEEGDCLVQTIGTYGTLKNFPECHRVDRVTNFFLGRTDKVREVGFDPAYSRFAHTEFFYEGLGKLRSAACSFAKIGHNQKSNDQYLFSKAAAAAVGMVTVKAAPMGAKACTYTSPDDTSIDKGYKVYLGNCAACH
ncbi:B4GALNT2 [Branchiostoma lanceolatum]|uniref:B4GALNT2 protein n=1 Tax=Branchiostoma lanceolatum TaxID=7740 RepID=A0A8J9ZXI3_BRALA|nr:B4GALNT2 [Branchiostoma lanceolatum]